MGRLQKAVVSDVSFLWFRWWREEIRYRGPALVIAALLAAALAHIPSFSPVVVAFLSAMPIVISAPLSASRFASRHWDQPDAYSALRRMGLWTSVWSAVGFIILELLFPGSNFHAGRALSGGVVIAWLYHAYHMGVLYPWDAARFPRATAPHGPSFHSFNIHASTFEELVEALARIPSLTTEEPRRRAIAARIHYGLVPFDKLGTIRELRDAIPMTQKVESYMRRYGFEGLTHSPRERLRLLAERILEWRSRDRTARISVHTASAFAQLLLNDASVEYLGTPPHIDDLLAIKNDLEQIKNFKSDSDMNVKWNNALFRYATRLIDTWELKTVGFDHAENRPGDISAETMVHIIQKHLSDQEGKAVKRYAQILYPHETPQSPIIAFTGSPHVYGHAVVITFQMRISKQDTRRRPMEVVFARSVADNQLLSWDIKNIQRLTPLEPAYFPVILHVGNTNGVQFYVRKTLQDFHDLSLDYSENELRLIARGPEWRRHLSEEETQDGWVELGRFAGLSALTPDHYSINAPLITHTAFVSSHKPMQIKVISIPAIHREKSLLDTVAKNLKAGLFVEIPKPHGKSEPVYILAARFAPFLEGFAEGLASKGMPPEEVYALMAKACKLLIPYANRAMIEQSLNNHTLMRIHELADFLNIYADEQQWHNPNMRGLMRVRFGASPVPMRLDLDADASIDYSRSSLVQRLTRELQDLYKPNLIFRETVMQWVDLASFNPAQLPMRIIRFVLSKPFQSRYWLLTHREISDVASDIYDRIVQAVTAAHNYLLPAVEETLPIKERYVRAYQEKWKIAQHPGPYHVPEKCPAQSFVRRAPDALPFLAPAKDLPGLGVIALLPEYVKARHEARQYKFIQLLDLKHFPDLKWKLRRILKKSLHLTIAGLKYGEKLKLDRDLPEALARAQEVTEFMTSCRVEVGPPTWFDAGSIVEEQYPATAKDLEQLSDAQAAFGVLVPNPRYLYHVTLFYVIEDLTEAEKAHVISVLARMRQEAMSDPIKSYVISELGVESMTNLDIATIHKKFPLKSPQQFQKLVEKGRPMLIQTIRNILDHELGDADSSALEPPLVGLLGTFPHVHLKTIDSLAAALALERVTPKDLEERLHQTRTQVTIVNDWKEGEPLHLRLEKYGNQPGFLLAVMSAARHYSRKLSWAIQIYGTIDLIAEGVSALMMPYMIKAIQYIPNIKMPFNDDILMDVYLHVFCPNESLLWNVEIVLKTLRALDKRIDVLTFHAGPAVDGKEHVLVSMHAPGNLSFSRIATQINSRIPGGFEQRCATIVESAAAFSRLIRELFPHQEILLRTAA